MSAAESCYATSVICTYIITQAVIQLINSWHIINYEQQSATFIRWPPQNTSNTCATIQKKKTRAQFFIFYHIVMPDDFFTMTTSLYTRPSSEQLAM